MDLITVDFETYYDKDYSLSKISTEDYVCDDRFEIIGVAIKWNNDKTIWYEGHKEAIRAIKEIDWTRCALLCQNTAFDGLIMAVHCDCYPALYLDTMLMARATIYPRTRSVSLAKISKALNLWDKGTEVVRALGKRLRDFTRQEIKAYGLYCINDVDLTYEVFRRLKHFFSHSELIGIDITLRMYLEPELELDSHGLLKELVYVRSAKEKLLNNLPDGIEKEQLMSNQKFAKALESFGVTPPTKTSPTTGKETYAFAKTDFAFKALMDHEDERVQALVAGRLGAKSTIMETRLARLYDISTTYPKLRCPIKYYAAHTGRWGGYEGINLQNLPKKGRIRHCIKAPDGFKIIAADFSQIEARITAWLADEHLLLKAFAEGLDPYIGFASKLYRKPAGEITDEERFYGKTAILGLGYGMGHAKYKDTVRSWGGQMTEEEAKRTVQLYRGTNTRISRLWHVLDNMLPNMMAGAKSELKCIRTGYQRIELPNGLWLDYPNLRMGPDGYEYGDGKKLYGAKLCENIVQALARIVMNEAMVNLYEAYRPLLTVHDEIIFCAGAKSVDRICKTIYEEMIEPPEWAADLPLEAEIKYGDTYGEAK
jgi:DNA polymerase